MNNKQLAKERKEETSEIQIYVRSTEADGLKLLGKLKRAQLKLLTAHLDEEFSEDKDYYVNRDTLDFLKEQGVDDELIQLLEKALEGVEPEDGVDIVCPKMKKASNHRQRNKVVLQSAFDVVAGIMMILSLSLPWEEVISEFSGFHCGTHGSFPTSVLIVFIAIAIIMTISPIMLLLDKQNLFRKVSVMAPVVAVGAWYIARAEMAAPYRSYLKLGVGIVIFPYWCLLPLLGSLLSFKKSIEVQTKKQSNAITNGLAIGNALAAGLIILSLLMPWVKHGHRSILEWASRGGIPMLFIFTLIGATLSLLSSVVSPLRRNLRAIERISLLVPAVAFGVLIGFVFQIVTRYQGAWSIYGPPLGFFIFLCGCLLPLFGAFWPKIFTRKISEVEKIPSEILCPGCGTDLELDEKEIKEKMFTCPECKETFRVTD